MFADLRLRLRALFQRAQMEQELENELRFHLDRETEKHVRAGMSLADARRRARLEFGGVERIKDDVRDARGVGALDRVTQDFRYAARMLRARPGFTAAIVLTLGLGIGANAAMFGIIDRLLFRAPKYLIAPERVHRVFVSYIWDAQPRTERSIEYVRYTNLSAWTNAFDVTAVAAYRNLAVGTGDAAREMPVAVTSASFFDLFSAHPVIGRWFSREEDKPPMGTTVAVISYPYWQLTYAGAPNVLGRTLQIDRRIYTIVGVAPPGFVGITDQSSPAAFIPASAFAGSRNANYDHEYGWSWLDMFARRKETVPVTAANAELSTAYARTWDSEREASGSSGVTSRDAQARAFAAPVQLSRGPDAGPESKVASWVMAVAAIVLLIACANVANLLLARAVARRREIAPRLALGVTRWRLIQQLLTETMLLAALGAIAGVAFAQWGGAALRTLILRDAEVRPVVQDPRTLLFVAGAALIVAVLTGLAPALQAAQADVAGTLKAGAREGTYHRSRLRTALLLFQGAFSLVLLVGAGLFMRSLANVRAERLGYDVDAVVYAEGVDRGVNLTDAAARALIQRLQDAARSTPGVTSASLTISVPFWSSEGRGAPKVPGRDSLSRLGRFMLQAGSPSYFETLGTRILRGRSFTESDNERAPPVALVSETMARVVWPGQDALGKVMRIGTDTMPYMTVIGVVEDIRSRDIRGDREFTYYMPIAQYNARYGDARPAFFIRTSGNAADFAPVLQRRMQREMPGASYIRAMPLRSLVAPQEQSWQFGATMFVAFGGLALVLAAIGLYSVVTYAVAQRVHELGVRIALGADVGDVVRLVLRQGVLFALGGIAIGSAIAIVAARAVQPLLYRESAYDIVVYGAVAALLLTVAVIATLRPALWATRVNPTEALRSD